MGNVRDLAVIGGLWLKEIAFTHAIYASFLAWALYVRHWGLLPSIRLLKIVALTEMALMGIVTLYQLHKKDIRPHGGFFWLSSVATLLCVFVFGLLLTSFVLDLHDTPNIVHALIGSIFGVGSEKITENILSTTPIYFFLIFNVLSYFWLGATPPEVHRKNHVMYIIACVDIPCVFAITVLFVLAYGPRQGLVAPIALDAFVSGALALLLIVSNTVNRALEVLSVRYQVVRQPDAVLQKYISESLWVRTFKCLAWGSVAIWRVASRPFSRPPKG